MRAIWQVAVEAPVVLLMVACTGTGDACLVGGFLSLSSLHADIDGAAAVGGIAGTGAG